MNIYFIEENVLLKNKYSPILKLLSKVYLFSTNLLYSCLSLPNRVMLFKCNKTNTQYLHCLLSK